VGALERSVGRGRVPPSGGELVRCWSSVFGEGQGVDHEREAEEVDPLAAVADGVRPAQEEGVVEGAVDGFGIVALPEQPVEVVCTCIATTGVEAVSLTTENSAESKLPWSTPPYDSTPG